MVGTTIKLFISKIADKLPFLIRKQCKSLNMFVHIPKTAGTSFRASLEKTKKVVCDYGEGKEHTSSEITEYVYLNKDIYGLKQAISDKETWLCGHMHLNKYLGMVVPQNIVTFVREPLARVISHYNHEVRWGANPNVTLEEFLQSNRASNFQHRFLQGLPLSLVGFVGVTEQYAASLELLETEMMLKVEEEQINQNTQKASNETDFTPEILSLIKEQNALDQKLYDSAKTIIKERQRLAGENVQWTYIYAEVTPNNRLRGVAFRRDDDNPIILTLILDGAKKCSIVASELTPLFPSALFPRDRFVGFSYAIPKSFNNDINIELQVEDTKQSYTVTRQ